MSEFISFNSDLLGEKYYKTVHESGLTVCVFPKDMSTTYGVLSVNFGGSITEYERAGEKVILPEGCAHFLEHKLFESEDLDAFEREGFDVIFEGEEEEFSAEVDDG